eukprot:Hpha_TRINITY_DN13506_c0_g1::TRINITY_DN13506_c0_g1_i1::g.111249::m.111249
MLNPNYVATPNTPGGLPTPVAEQPPPRLSIYTGDKPSRAPSLRPGPHRSGAAPAAGPPPAGRGLPAGAGGGSPQILPNTRSPTITAAASPPRPSALGPARPSMASPHRPSMASPPRPSQAVSLPPGFSPVSPPSRERSPSPPIVSPTRPAGGGRGRPQPKRAAQQGYGKDGKVLSALEVQRLKAQERAQQNAQKSVPRNRAGRPQMIRRPGYSPPKAVSRSPGRSGSDTSSESSAASDATGMSRGVRSRKRNAEPILRTEMRGLDGPLTTLDKLFDTSQEPPVTNIYIVTEVIRNSLALTMAALKSLLRVSGDLEEILKPSQVLAFCSAYSVKLPKAGNDGRSVTLPMLAKSMVDNGKCEKLVSDMFNLADVKLIKGELATQEDLATFLLRFKLEIVMDEIVQTAVVHAWEAQARKEMQDAERDESATTGPMNFYWDVIKPNLSAASLQRMWRQKLARRDLIRRKNLKALGFDPTASRFEDMASSQGGRSVARTTRTKDTRQRKQQVAEAKLDTLTFIALRDLAEVCIRSDFLLVTVLAQMCNYETPRPRTPMTSRDLLWIGRGYGIEIPEDATERGNLTLWNVTTMIKDNPPGLEAMLYDALHLAGIKVQPSYPGGPPLYKRMPAGVDYDDVQDFLKFYTAERELRMELVRLKCLQSPEQPLAGGLLTLLSGHIDEVTRRAQIGDDESIDRQFTQARLERQLGVEWMHIATAGLLSGGKEDTADDRVPLIRIRNNAELVKYGEMMDLERIVMCQMTARKWLAMKHFRELLALNRGAVRVQKTWRMIQRRRNFRSTLAAQRRLRDLGARIIQQRWRGHAARRMWKQDAKRVLEVERYGRGLMQRRWLFRRRCAMHLLQHVGRGMMARTYTQAILWTKCSLGLQCAWRRHVAQRELAWLRYRKRCCMQLQRIIRAGFMRCALRDLCADLLLQRVVRAAGARVYVWKLRRAAAAACCMQRTWRSYKARRVTDRRREERDAAMCIQRAWKCAMARQERKNRVIRRAAAITIQRVERGRQGRRRRDFARLVRASYLALQAFGRGMVGRLFVTASYRRFVAALFLQSAGRGMWGRDIATGLRHRGMMMQRVGRGLLGRYDTGRLMHLRLVAFMAKRLQRCWRIQMSVRVVRKRRALWRQVERLQRVGRAHMFGRITACTERARIALLSAALRLQAIGRGLHGRVTARCWHQLATKRIQAAGRGFAARQQVVWLRRVTAAEYLCRCLWRLGAVAKIQRFCGEFNRLRADRQRVWRIERVGRGLAVRRRLWTQRHCALLFQRIGRGVVAGRAVVGLQRGNLAAGTIQRAYRSATARGRAAEARRCLAVVRRLQRIGRGACERIVETRGHKLMTMSLRIQCSWRQHSARERVKRRREEARHRIAAERLLNRLAGGLFDRQRLAEEFYVARHSALAILQPLGRAFVSRRDCLGGLQDRRLERRLRLEAVARLVYTRHVRRLRIAVFRRLNAPRLPHKLRGETPRLGSWGLRVMDP